MVIEEQHRCQCIVLVASPLIIQTNNINQLLDEYCTVGTIHDPWVQRMLPLGAIAIAITITLLLCNYNDQLLLQSNTHNTQHNVALQ